MRFGCLPNELIRRSTSAEIAEVMALFHLREEEEEERRRLEAVQRALERQ